MTAPHWARRLTFSHMSPILKRVAREHVDLSAYPRAPIKDNAEHGGQSLPRRFLAAQRSHIAWILLFIAAIVAVRVNIPFSIKEMVKTFELATTRQELVWASVKLGLLQVGAAWLAQHYLHRLSIAQQTLLQGLLRALLERIRGIAPSERAKVTPGFLANAVSHDAESVSIGVRVVAEILFSVAMLVTGIVALFTLLGPIFWPAVAIYGIALLILKVGGALLARQWHRVLKAHDERMNFLGKVWRSLSVLKAEAREASVLADNDARAEADKKLQKSYLRVKFSVQTLQGAAALAAPVLTFLILALQGVQLDKAALFSSLAVFAMLDGPLASFANNLSELFTAQASARRLHSIWRLAQVPKKEYVTKETAIKIDGLQVHLGGKHILDHIRTEIAPGEAVAIVGAPGAGKSTFLNALAGVVENGGAVMYPQLAAHEQPLFAHMPHEPLTVCGSIRDNILFGNSCDLSPMFLQQCCLNGELTLLDSKKIHEEGHGISGGQRQRLALARMAANDASILYLDDPTTALDPLSERRVFNQLLFGAWRHKTRVVALTKLQYLSRFDRVLVLDEGRMIYDGDYVGYSARFGALTEADLQHHGVEPESQAQTSPAVPASSTIVEGKASHLLKDFIHHAASGKKVWRQGLFLGVSFVLAMIVPQLQSLWIAFSDEWEWVTRLDAMVPQLNGHFLGYAIVGFLALIFIIHNNWRWNQSGFSAARSLHRSTLSALLHAPTTTTRAIHSGEWNLRFLKDYISVEQYWSMCLLLTLSYGTQALIQLLTIGFLAPLSIGAMVPGMFGYYLLQKKYRAGLKQARDWLGVARSDLLLSTKEYFSAAPGIQTRSQETFFAQRYYRALSTYQTAFFGMNLMHRWFSLRVPLCGAGMFVLTAATLTQSGSLVGFLALAVISLSERMEAVVRAAGDLTTHAASWKRLSEWTRLPAEPSGTHQQLDHAAISFERISAAYPGQQRPILQDFSLSIGGGEHVAVMGASGCGKSTLLQLVLRFLTEQRGTVRLGGVAAQHWNVHALRQHVAFVPQDAVIWGQSLHDLLDPRHLYSEQEIWQRLRGLSLDHVFKKWGSLNGPLRRDLSRGERQMMACLRSILSGKRIILLDEATANMDASMEEDVMRALSCLRQQVTVIMVAHKESAVRYCDRVVYFDPAGVREERPAYQNMAPSLA